MLIGWVQFIRKFFSKKTDFVSVDARRFSNSPKNYEMITSPPSRAGDNVIKIPEPVVTSPPPKEEYDGLSPLAQSPRSRSSQYTNSVDYFGKDITDYEDANFGKEAEYKSPKLSFSTPRPPSAGRPTSSGNRNSVHRAFLPQRDPSSLESHIPGTQFSSTRIPRRGTDGRSFSPVYEWDPTSTHAKPSQR